MCFRHEYPPRTKTVIKSPTASCHLASIAYQVRINGLSAIRYEPTIRHVPARPNSFIGLVRPPFCFRGYFAASRRYLRDGIISEMNESELALGNLFSYICTLSEHKKKKDNPMLGLIQAPGVNQHSRISVIYRISSSLPSPMLTCEQLVKTCTIIYSKYNINEKNTTKTLALYHPRRRSHRL